MNDLNIVDGLKSLMSSFDNSKLLCTEPLPHSGSDRRYFRLVTDKGHYIGCHTPDASEGMCFVELAEAFKTQGRAVPSVIAVSSDFRMYIQEDLGDMSLFSVLRSEGSEQYVKETLCRLVELQKTPEKLWSGRCMHAPFCKRQVMWDLNYFKYEYLKPSASVFDEDALEDDFEKIAQRLLSIPTDFQGFMMRDCQSRNVMMTDGGPVFIDFQGGRKGPALYDAVSFLWQARAGFDSRFRKEMLDFYCSAFCDGDLNIKEAMLSYLDDIVLFRTLQVLGAYGFRGVVQRKAHFLLSIPGALKNLEELIENGVLKEYPELKRCSESLISNFEMRSETDLVGLTVEIYSFSYKKGYPEDLSGNGGGFMFDCRAIHNPGRYQRYKMLTGRDQEVKDFLETRGEIQGFLKCVWSLTDPAIERYLSRGFTRLQIGFGCTGGQHRSVYSAEATAAHIAETFPDVTIRLIHRENPRS